MKSESVESFYGDYKKLQEQFDTLFVGDTHNKAKEIWERILINMAGHQKFTSDPIYLVRLKSATDDLSTFLAKKWAPYVKNSLFDNFRRDITHFSGLTKKIIDDMAPSKPNSILSFKP